MNIVKTTMDCYRIRNNGEHATICLSGYHLQRDDRHGCELLINSSYGSFAYHWSHCGEPYRKFLIGLDKGYLLGKLVPQKDLYEYDNVGSLRALRQHILENRREDVLGKGWARKLWDSSCDLDSFLSAEEFVSAIQEDNELNKLNEPWDFCRTKQCARYDHFWNEIWVPFVNQLKEEVNHEC